MSGLISQVGWGAVEIVSSTAIGASFCTPFPPMALLVIPACIISSTISVVAQIAFNKMLKIKDDAFLLKTVIKAVCFVGGAGIVVGIVVACPISLSLICTVSAIIIFASLGGIVVVVIIKNGIDATITFGSKRRRVNVYPTQVSFTPHVPSRTGLPRRRF